MAENLYWAICSKLQKLVQAMDEVPEELQTLDDSLSDTYFCNFSLFQSIPDSWAIKQLFPIMPIHRLNERPTRHAVLGDITCDSDGKIDQFIDRRDVKRTPSTRSTIRPTTSACSWWARTRRSSAICTTSSATRTPCVSLDADDAVVLDAVIKGDTVREVLDYVEFDADLLITKLRTDVEAPCAADVSTTRKRVTCCATKTAWAAIPTSKRSRSAKNSRPEACTTSDLIQ
jgi:arginine decarboxylase